MVLEAAVGLGVHTARARLDPEGVEVATGTLDLVRHAFHRAGGDRVALTTREAELLGYLAARAPKAVDRDQILVEVWGHRRLSFSRAIDATVGRLRKKLEVDPAAPQVLVTVHGHGYRLVLGDSDPGIPDPAPPRPPLRLGSTRVDLVTGRVHADGGAVQLTARERYLLEQLLQAGGAWVSAERIAQCLGRSGRPGVVSNLAYRLRQKVEPDPAHPAYIESRRGFGYRLRARSPEPSISDDTRFRALRSLTDHVGLLGFVDCVVYVRRDGVFEQVAAHGPKRARDGGVREPLRQRPGEGLAGACALDGESILVVDTREDSRYLPDLFPARSELAVPIRLGGEVVGVIDSEAPEPGRFTPRDEAVFVSLAVIAAAAFPPAGGPS